MSKSGALKLRGFTLIELAIVIAIVALVLGSLLIPLATQIQGQNVKETRQALKEIKEALTGFAVTQGRLPCPDTDRDGVENSPCSVNPNSVEGFLPWRDLGVPATDAWGRVFRYAVTSEFTVAAIPGAPPATDRLDLSDDTQANITVVTRGDNPGLGAGGETKEAILLTTSAPAVVLSVGSNGLGGSRIDGTDLAFAALGTDEFINVVSIFPPATSPPPQRAFVHRPHTPETSPCSDTSEAQPFCEYDDILIWLSASVLLNRMVEARQLP